MHFYPQITTRNSEVSWISFFIVYSIPIVLVLTIVCIIKWRPIQEFPNIRSFLSWYCSCSPSRVVRELEQIDRTHMILAIDAQSLASTCDSPLLFRQNNEEIEKFEMTAIP
ncbi:unnamed protein product [Caenorhabditis angaria]|uniref:Uncharacterized protein n=1 Tax=Caenorhabditis angaria TaxID=860376 RepID=A0A9P1I5K9_9PELO|nr:unnamed protein product [Caenorhabditis angaria]